ncbi:MAG: rhamnosyltransferase [Nitrospirales bacterium]|nr:MAG: rhamnosyltransferase [Nitrospirales bacterium]
MDILHDKACTVPHVCVAIVNWNSGPETLECLESVFRLDYQSYQVIVCDNDSSDGSMEDIQAWAEGRLDVLKSGNPKLRAFSFPPIEKPVKYVVYDRSMAESGGKVADSTARLILIQTGKNLGFAGGCNVAMRHALERASFDYVWLLNNDTVVSKDSLSELVGHMKMRPGAGICGSTLLSYDEPDQVQALGGVRYNKWIGTIEPIGEYQSISKLPRSETVEKQMSYVLGASMLVSRQFLGDIGLLSEEYFLYYEELDWVFRSRSSYSLAYAPKSLVYHKGGGTINSQKVPSEAIDFLALRNRLYFTYKHAIVAFPSVWITMVGVVLNRIRRGQIKRVFPIIQLMLGKWELASIFGKKA